MLSAIEAKQHQIVRKQTVKRLDLVKECNKVKVWAALAVALSKI
jgi:hypothetical protein